MTPPTDLERDLRSAMAPGPVDLRPDPDFTRATVARATRERPRRRVAYAVGLPLAAAAVTAGVVVVIQREVTTAPAPAVETPDRRDPVDADADVPLRRWLENRTLDPTYGDRTQPAAAGTAMYRGCDGDDCAVTLVSPSGERIDLADVHPGLAESLAEDGLAGVSLSPTGHWLGRPEDGAYRVYNLDMPGVSDRVAADPRGDRWELVGWSEQSWAPMLALYDGDRVVRYANWVNLTVDAPKFVDVPDGVVTAPIMGYRTYLVPVAQAAEPVGAEWPRVTTTTPPTDEWLVVRNLRGVYPAAGTVLDTSDREDGESFQRCLAADETLIGPDGLMHTWQVRGSRPVHADTLTAATEVFSRESTRTEPVAVILYACDGAPWTSDGDDYFPEGLPRGGRLDLPTSTAGETWSFLGMLPDGQVALLHDVQGGATTYVRLDESGTLTPMHTLPDGAEVITPGGVVG